MVELLDDPKAPSVFLHVRDFEVVSVVSVPFPESQNIPFNPFTF